MNGYSKLTKSIGKTIIDVVISHDKSVFLILDDGSSININQSKLSDQAEYLAKRFITGALNNTNPFYILSSNSLDQIVKKQSPEKITLKINNLVFQMQANGSYSMHISR